MKTSKEWVAHFKQNLLAQRIDWDRNPSITTNEKKKIIKSLQAWQLGETSDGSHLLNASTKYALRINDPEYIEAVKLFIIEEQKHGNNLGRYLDRIGAGRIKKDWGDTLFRKVRYYNTNMEIWTIAVIIVESYAQLFYKAIADATNCILLKEICGDILKDEAHHIKFQLERLCIITSNRSPFINSCIIVLYSLLFHAIFISVWIGHNKAFKAGGHSFLSLYNKSKRKFSGFVKKVKEVNYAFHHRSYLIRQSLNISK